MLVQKRDKSIQVFDANKIKQAIIKANKDVDECYQIWEGSIDEMVEEIVHELTSGYYPIGLDDVCFNIEEIQDAVELCLQREGYYMLAKKYIKYRYQRALTREFKKRDDEVFSLISGENEELNKENSNKDTRLLSTMRDYMAGIVCKDIGKRIMIPKDIVEAHEQGIIHIHDMDYSPAMPLYNCSLINLEDMLQNGTVISGIKIEKPHSFRTACTIATQIIAQVASNQYGGNTISLAHLAPFVDITRQKFKKDIINDLELIGTKVDEDKINKIVEEKVKEEVRSGIQTIQYQLITISTTNGQSPFTSSFMYLDEVPEGQTRDDLAMIIEEVLKQRIEGVKNEQGVPITIAFPKLLYVLDEDNIHEDSKYYYLTELAAECSTKRLVPDYISAKKMKELKDGNVFPCMGALSGHEHLYIKINNGDPIDISIKDFFDLCKGKEVDGRPMQLYYNKPRLNVPTDEDWKHKQTKGESTIQNKSGVYKVTYIPQDISYIGSSKKIKQRIRDHKKCIRHRGGLDSGLNFGDTSINNYKFEVLEYTEDYKEAEKNYIMSVPNANFKGIANKYYKNVGITKGEGYDERPNIQMDSSIPQDIVNLEGFDIKVLDMNNKWTKVNRVFKNSKFNTPLMMHITYNENDKVYTLCCTEDHPLWIGDKFVEACKLKLGDNLYRADGMELPINRIKWCTDRMDSYDISTETGSFIGSDIIMHNCRSFLQPYYEDGKPKFYSRFNQGVVTLNLPDIALSSGGDFDKFWKIFDERLELCYRALMVRHNRLLGTPSDVAPILWQHGAIARLKPGETIDKLLFNDYSSISLGYAGLYECIKYMTGESQLEENGYNFGIKVMQALNDACAKWKEETNIGFSVYGSPIESTTYKFAKCLRKRFGVIEGITDKDYVTNSYHITPSQPIDAFSKLSIESDFQALSLGGAISYVETPNVEKNPKAILEVIKHIYNNIMYAEINTMTSYCQVCGCTDIKMGDDLKFHCPNCGNDDFNKMNVAVRICGYISTNPFNEGRAEDIHNRVYHLGAE